MKFNKERNNPVWITALFSAVIMIIVTGIITGAYYYISPYETYSEPVSKSNTTTESSNTNSSDSNETNTKIKVNEEPLDLQVSFTLRLYRGDKINLKVKKKNYAEKIKVSTSNKNVATIGKDGLIKAKHCGKAKLVMKLQYKKNIKTITLKTIVRKCSYRSRKNLCMYIDESSKIATYSKTADTTITVKSTNNNVASIENNVIKANKNGKTNIVTTAKSGDYETELSFELNVEKKPELEITNKTIDNWFNGSIIAGHSIGCGFQMYCNMQYDGYLGSARHLCRNCYGVYNDRAAITSSSLHLTVNGKKARLKDHVKSLHAKKVFINYGLNDIGNPPERFISDYESLINELIKENKKTTAYIISPTPMFKGRGGLNNHNMRIINKALKQYAKKTKRVEFIDMFTPLIDSSGKLRSDLCSDHYCHLTFAGYKIYGDTLREFAKSRLIKDTDKEDREFTKNEVKKYKLTK